MSAKDVCENLCPKKSCESTGANRLRGNDEDADVRTSSTTNMTGISRLGLVAAMKSGSSEKSRKKRSKRVLLIIDIDNMAPRQF
jgi:hypothetical protein